jgi:spoIIIJ-associated protein
MADIQLIKKTIEDILSLLNISYELEVVEDESIGTIKFHIKTGEPQVLIGRDGTHLAALSHIIKRITDKVNRGEDRPISFLVDVNDYQEKQLEDLKGKAIILAERARYFKSDVEMNPMTPYERMIIHSIFASAKDIKTESIGEGKNRRIVIKYITAGDQTP